MSLFTRFLFCSLTPPAVALGITLLIPELSVPQATAFFLLGLLISVGCVTWHFRDIPEISHREKKYRRVFDFSPDYMIVGRLKDGRIVNANTGFEKLTGYSIAEAIGKTTADLGLWANSTLRQEFLDRLREQGTVYESPNQLIRRDGTKRDVLSSATIFELDGVAYYVAIVRDVSATLAIQQQLSASEARLKTIFDASPAPICLSRCSDNTYLTVNPAWEALYERSNAEIAGKTYGQCGIRCVDNTTLRAQTASLLASGRIDDAEAAFVTPSGRRVSIIYSSRVIDLDGEDVIVSINTDITSLKETEQHLKTLVDAAPIPITITRLADHTYLQFNHEFEKMVGLPAEQILGKNLLQVGYIPTQPATLSEQTQRLLACGKLDNEQLNFTTPDGRQCTLMYSSRIIEINSEPAIITIANDISQLKAIEAGLRKAEAARSESEARFAALFQSSPVPMAVFNVTADDYLVSELNAAWYKIFAFQPEQFIGLNTISSGFWADNTDRERLLRKVEQEGDLSDFECWLRRADNRRIFCSISCSLVQCGERRLLIAAYLDITERHRIEEEIRQLNSHLEQHILERTQELRQAQSNLMQSEKLASLGSLVAGVAHEINTPIGNSMTVASTLADQARNMRQMMLSGMKRSALENYITDAESGTDILTRNLQRATELIQSFKSIAIDQASDQRRNFDLRQVIEETLIALRPSFKKKHFAVFNEVEDGLAMNSYPGPLEQVVVNFINNAILHGFDGREQGHIRLCGTPLGDDWIKLSVIDDGVGISSANLPRIFDPYFTTKSGSGGSGLGLHIVRKIVEHELGGRVRVSSSLGQGTEMAIELPRLAPDKSGTCVYS